MSAQHVMSQRQDRPQSVAWRDVVFYIGMLLCLALFVLAISPLWTFGDAVAEAGPEASASLFFTLWSFSIPLGVLLAVIGAAIGARVNAGRTIIAVVVALLVAMLPFSVYPGESVPVIFGIGGAIIELALLALIWFWYQERTRVSGTMRLASDLQMGGYMFFAFAAWFICGMGGMPTFALYPEKMIEFGTQSFAVRLMYCISLCLVLGWALTAVSQYLRSRELKRV